MDDLDNAVSFLQRVAKKHERELREWEELGRVIEEQKAVDAFTNALTGEDLDLLRDLRIGI